MKREVIKQDFVRKIGEMKLRLLEREKLEKELSITLADGKEYVRADISKG